MVPEHGTLADNPGKGVYFAHGELQSAILARSEGVGRSERDEKPGSWENEEKDFGPLASLEFLGPRSCLEAKEDL